MLSIGDKYWGQEGKIDLAIETYMASLDKSRAFFRHYFVIIWRLSEKEMWTGLISFLEKLLLKADDAVITDFMGYGINDEGESFALPLARAVKETNRWDVLASIYDKAIAAGPSFDYRTLYRVHYLYGQALLRRNGHEEAGLAPLEAIFHLSAPTGRDFERASIIQLVISNLVPVYLKLAKSKTNTPETKERHFGKLEELRKQFEALGAARTDNSDASIALARYLHVRGDDAGAKALTRGYIVQALEMLSDDDPENDQMSFWNLGRVFSVFDDMVNAPAAWEMMSQSTQADYQAYLDKKAVWEKKVEAKRLAKEAKDAKEATSETTPTSTDGKGDAVDKDAPNHGSESAADDDTQSEDDIEEPDEPDRAIAFCDGCGDRWMAPSEIWTCMDDGGQVQFDEKCYRKLQEGTLAKAICDRDHTFWLLGKRDDAKLDAVPKGSVLVGGQVITQEAWKKQLRTQYVEYDAVAAEAAVVDVSPSK